MTDEDDAWISAGEAVKLLKEVVGDEYSAQMTICTRAHDELISARALDNAAFAFLVLTAEDEQASGKMQARMNVIHEVGLFQGRLGFKKAIILLEDVCEEFSNIAGLNQIRFQAGSISAKFKDVRRVLEREGIIQGE